MLRIAHTADLDTSTRAAIRRLMDAAFGTVSDDTFENVLGGVHALVAEDGDLIGHASVVQRRMLYGGRALRTGYIEGVAVREDRRRQGHGAAMMSALERIVRSGYQLGALGASRDGSRLYTARGWQLWRGPSAALTPDGIRRTADMDGAIYVLPVSVPVDVSGELVCDWRPGAVWLCITPLPHDPPSDAGPDRARSPGLGEVIRARVRHSRPWGWVRPGRRESRGTHHGHGEQELADMQDDPTPRSDNPAEGVNLPLPGVKTAQDMGEAESEFLTPDAQLETNELHAGGRTCARCGQTIGPDEDVRRTASGSYQHEFCPAH